VPFLFVCCQGGNSSEGTLDKAVGLIVVVGVVVLIAGAIWFRALLKKDRDPKARQDR
jgi:hypothetical protein